MRKDSKIALEASVMFVTALILSGCSAHQPGEDAVCSNSQTVTVLCERNKITVTDTDKQPHDDTICANRGGTIQWEVASETEDGTTLTIHEFKKKRKFFGYNKNRKPTTEDTYTAKEQDAADGEVKDTDEENKPLEGRFKYSLTCTFSDGDHEKKDPIIEIPRFR